MFTAILKEEFSIWSGQMMCFPSRHMPHFFDNGILNFLWESTPFLHSGCVVRVDANLFEGWEQVQACPVISAFPGHSGWFRSGKTDLQSICLLGDFHRVLVERDPLSSFESIGNKVCNLEQLGVLFAATWTEGLGWKKKRERERKNKREKIKGIQEMERDTFLMASFGHLHPAMPRVSSIPEFSDYLSR